MLPFLPLSPLYVAQLDLLYSSQQPQPTFVYILAKFFYFADDYVQESKSVHKQQILAVS
jgi:hypothetical protein